MCVDIHVYTMCVGWYILYVCMQDRSLETEHWLMNVKLNPDTAEYTGETEGRLPSDLLPADKEGHNMLYKAASDWFWTDITDTWSVFSITISSSS